MTAQKNWTVLHLLNTTAAYFEEKQIEQPRLNAEHLLSKALNMARFNLYVAFDRPVTPQELDRFRSYVKRRAQREPLQYIMGDTEFMGLPFRVNPSVLIPRPETETLVETILERKAACSSGQPVIVDVGSGSGCIGVSLAKLWPGAQVFAVDISSEALDMARLNAKENGVGKAVHCMEYDIFENWTQSLPAQVDILVSNPPYIAVSEMETLQPEVREYEPQIALTDQADGLRFYKRLFELAAAEHPPQLKRMFLEMSGSQPDAIIQLARSFPFKQIDITNDLTRIPRVLEVTI